jgi:hypothetical protein
MGGVLKYVFGLEHENHVAVIMAEKTRPCHPKTNYYTFEPERGI